MYIETVVKSAETIYFGMASGSVVTYIPTSSRSPLVHEYFSKLSHAATPEAWKRKFLCCLPRNPTLQRGYKPQDKFTKIHLGGKVWSGLGGG